MVVDSRIMAGAPPRGLSPTTSHFNIARSVLRRDSLRSPLMLPRDIRRFKRIPGMARDFAGSPSSPGSKGGGGGVAIHTAVFLGRSAEA